MDITFFNPRAQKEEDFMLGFVARQTTFNYFMQQLRLAKSGQAAKHHLVVAPRGYGKTSLLRRIGIAIKQDEAFSQRYIALSFREEQHNVISLDVFWRNCLQSLQEALEDEGAGAAVLDELDKVIDANAVRHTLKREAQDGEPAWQAMRQWADQSGRRPVLLVDNLDALLAGLSDQHQWALRRTLQQEDGPILLAAASRTPENIHNREAAFYDFFRMHTLDRLDDAEVMHCLRMMAQNRGERGKRVLELLDRELGRISALNTMAGGNPRTLSVLYSVLEANMSEDILSQLSAMLDTFTGWYQARTEELPLQARAVFDALALNWDPMTAAALAEVTGLEVTAISAHLSRLEKAAYVEAVSLSSRKKGRNGYQVSERFYNVWYLMRHGARKARLRVQFLTAFIQSCFTPSERWGMARRLLKGGSSSPTFALGLASGMRESPLKNRLLDHVETLAAKNPASSEYGEVAKSMRKKPQINQQLKNKQLITVNDSKMTRAYSLVKLENYVEAERMIREVLSAETDYPNAWNYLGHLLAKKLNREEDAERAFKEAIHTGDKSSNPWINLFFLFSENQKRYEEAEEAIRKTIEIDKKRVLWQVLLGCLLLDARGQSYEALTAYHAGLEVEPDDACLHGNCAYVYSLHLGDQGKAKMHATKAKQTNVNPMATVGTVLLDALPCWDETFNSWGKSWEQIDIAVQMNDPLLHTDYVDDLQRLLAWFIINNQGEFLLEEMYKENYPERYAPLYHAVVAAMEGEDHLLKINMETRPLATRIYEGLARMIRLHGKAKK
jgi:Flp pilus assembly protein TadD/DNA-binding transcriptional ArsR family regulator